MPERVKKVLARINYRDLADLIFILEEQAKLYHDIDDSIEDLTVDQFTEWLLEMPGSVELTSTTFVKDGD